MPQCLAAPLNLSYTATNLAKSLLAIVFAVIPLYSLFDRHSNLTTCVVLKTNFNSISKTNRSNLLTISDIQAAILNY